MTNFINEKGVLSINDTVLARIAGLTALECSGIVGMTTGGIRQGIVHILRREHVAKGIKIHHEDGGISIDFHIIVSYGVNISAVAQNLVSAVSYNIKEQTSMNINKINIFIDGVRVID